MTTFEQLEAEFPHVFGNPLYIPIALVHALISKKARLNEAILLSYLVSGPGLSKNNYVWIHKTCAELIEGTGMTYEKLRTARRKLKELGLIEERRQGMPPEVHFRVNGQAVRDLVFQHSGEEVQF